MVVGLGNPGIEYQFSPHNAGFLAIDRIAERCGAVVNNRRCRALTATARLAGREVVLAKPETFMNLSGLSVQALVREFELEQKPSRAWESNLIVIYDELALPLGSIRVRERGSSGGHNGAKSVSASLGTEEWLRIRVGVAPDSPAALEDIRSRQKDYLLSQLRKAELAALDGALDQAANAVEVILTRGVGAAMNEFNRRESNSPAE
ncbi:MAG TPA: aminoacyl-tRNA hydrolase [Acidisarcina sp.]